MNNTTDELYLYSVFHYGSSLFIVRGVVDSDLDKFGRVCLLNRVNAFFLLAVQNRRSLLC